MLINQVLSEELALLYLDNGRQSFPILALPWLVNVVHIEPVTFSRESRMSSESVAEGC